MQTLFQKRVGLNGHAGTSDYGDERRVSAASSIMLKSTSGGNLLVDQRRASQNHFLQQLISLRAANGGSLMEGVKALAEDKIARVERRVS